MATLTTEEKNAIVKRAGVKSAAAGVSIRWVKQAIYDSAQAIEDAVSGDINLTRTEVPAGPGIGFNIVVSGRIDTAASPYGITFTNAEKKWLFAYVMEQTYTRDG